MESLELPSERWKLFTVQRDRNGWTGFDVTYLAGRLSGYLALFASRTIFLFVETVSNLRRGATLRRDARAIVRNEHDHTHTHRREIGPGRAVAREAASIYLCRYQFALPFIFRSSFYAFSFVLCAQELSFQQHGNSFDKLRLKFSFISLTHLSEPPWHKQIAP